MIGRSTRDKERLYYEAGRAVTLLRIEALGYMFSGETDKADSRNAVADDLTKALNGQPTGFDFAGGRNEWLKQNERKASNG